MKIGVLHFSYASAGKSMQKVADDGFYTVNLGDCAQSIAVRRLLARIGVAAGDRLDVDRDSLPDYAGEPVALVMNGVFYDRNFPVPAAVTPIFIGFCTKSVDLVRRHRDWFRRHEPVGCRDVATADLMRAHGIAATVTGCLTMTLERRAKAPRKNRFFIVYGGGSGLLPPQCLKTIPAALLDRAEYIHHRLPVGEIPLSAASRGWIERYEGHLLDRYRDEAALVLTPLLHVASPCLAMGVPVVLCRRDHDSRFGLLETLMPVYTADDPIDWTPGPVDLSAIADRLAAQLTQRIAALAP